MVTVMCSRFIQTFGNVNFILCRDLKGQLIVHLKIKIWLYVKCNSPQCPLLFMFMVFWSK